MKKYYKAALFMPLIFCLLLAMLLFFRKKEEPPSLPSTEDSIPQTVSEEIIAEPAEEYLLIAEDNYLNLYQTGEVPSLKHSERLNIELLPHSDTSALYRGMYFSGIEAAYEAMESFIN